MTVSVHQPSKDMLIELINEENNLEILANQVNFSGIEPGSERNTLITITAIPGAPFIGDAQFEYDRLDIQTLFGANAPFVIADPETIGSTLDIIPLLNSLYNLQISSDDVIDSPVVGTSHTLVMSDESLAWKGSVVVTVVYRDETPPDAYLLDSGAPFMLDGGGILQLD